MADPQKLWLTAAQIAAAVAIGAGADRMAVTTYDNEARVSEIQYLADGQIAVDVETKIGDCRGQREYVYAIDGSNARLNGRPTDDADVLAIGAAAVALRDTALLVDKGIADRPVSARLLADGQIAIALAADTQGGTVYKEVVYAADGTAPRVNGNPVDEKTINDVGPIAAAFKVVAETKAPELKDELTKPLESVASVAVVEPAK